MGIRLLNKEKIPITNWLIEINDRNLLCVGLDQIDLIPIGGIIDTDNIKFEYKTTRNKSYLINIKDFTSNIIKDDYYIGCCGNDGDIMNIYDINNNEISYEFGDCWMNHFVEIPKENIIIETRKNKNIFTLFALSKYANQNYLIDRIIGTDKNEIIKKLDKQIQKRLKHELSKKEIIKTMTENINYINITIFKNEFLKNKKVEDLFLFTKYVGESSLV